MNASQIEDQNAIDEDEEIVVAVETETDAGGAVVDEVVARLVGEVGVVLGAGSRYDPAAIRQYSSSRTVRRSHAGREEVLVAGAGSPEGSATAMVPVGP